MKQESVVVTPFDAPFFEQRLLPIKLVALTEPVVVGSRTLAAGTFLYMVSNADQKIGFCTIKDRSGANQAKTLFIPAMDTRPCFVDTDKDGRFDGTFSVFDKYGGPPSARGSINGAQPLAAQVGYQVADIHDFPSDIRVALKFWGKRDVTSARISVDFLGPVGGDWLKIPGSPTGQGTLYNVMNAQAILRSVKGDTAEVEMRWTDSIVISSNNKNTLFWQPLPRFLAESQ